MSRRGPMCNGPSYGRAASVFEERAAADTIAVFTAKRGVLEKAKAILAEQGISCRITTPRKAEGLLKTAAADAVRAGALLRSVKGGRVMSESEAAWMGCTACGASLSLGAVKCAACGEATGDFHGR